MDLGVLLESPQGSQSSSREGACTCAFLPTCSSSVTLLFPWVKESVPFPRGFPKGLSHVPPWCVSISILGLKVDAVQGKQVSLERTETSVGLWEWWHDTGLPLPFPVESAPSNLHEDWPFMRPTERVSEVQVVSRELLLQLEKIRRFSPPGEMWPISDDASRGYSTSVWN